MAKTFLEQAREPMIGDRLNLRKGERPEVAKLAIRCWPEILAVVKAAEEVERNYPPATGEQMYRRNRLWHALDNLRSESGRMSIEKLRVDVKDLGHDGCKKCQQDELIRALLDEHEDTYDETHGQFTDTPWIIAEEAIRRYGESE